MTPRAEALKALLEGGATHRAVADAMDVSPKAARRAMDRVIADGLVAPTRTRKYDAGASSLRALIWPTRTGKITEAVAKADVSADDIRAIMATNRKAESLADAVLHAALLYVRSQTPNQRKSHGKGTDKT